MALSKRAKEALKMHAEQNTGQEAETAKEMLKESQLPALNSERMWLPRSELVQKVNEDKHGFRYIRAANMRYFLGYVKDGVPFNRYTVPPKEREFETDKFPSIMSWLASVGLVRKAEGMYIIDSVEDVRKHWNGLIDQSKL